MGSRTKEQKQQVNDTHCCVCFKLRTAALLSVCISLILITAYGYEYWLTPSTRSETPSKFYGYITIIAIEFALSAIGWIGIYNHIRSITKLFSYWTIIHLLIITMIFWVSTLFDYLHYGFFIGWIIVQLILLALLYKYKQTLKLIYGWEDDADDTEDSQSKKDDDS